MKKQILHIDFDSFFASVEQQANPFLRDKPIGVAGSTTNKGVICAASIQAKKIGIKTGMPVFMAREIKKDLELVKVDFNKYNYVHAKSLEIFSKYSDEVEVFSIDEVFMNITKVQKIHGVPHEIVKKIKTDIQQEFGTYITCSVGIAENKLLAKLASDINKPNGVFEITPENVNKVLADTPLQDFCGLGTQTYKRLNEIGVQNTKDLQDTSLAQLYKTFGKVQGSFLYQLGQGLGSPQVNFHPTKPKSMTHQQTQVKHLKTKGDAKTKLLQLTEQLVTQLRKQNMYCKKVYVRIKDENKTSHEQKISCYEHTNSRKSIYKMVQNCFEKLPPVKTYSFLDVGLNDLLEEEHVTKTLFDFDEDSKKLDEVIDKINNKWGEFTLQKRPMF